ncbi:MAG: acylneuraminate cytidylyltransferase [Spirochaetales bacterium]|jgi:spore coat polysaccharide biosynthesis protein SpsF|nr:acylneuraminate cytidylyltransferase [Spirochaetales bacterium]
MTGVFIQIRLDSSRLPGKALMPIAGKALALHALESLKKIPAGVHALLTEEASAEALRPLAAAAGFELFTGSKDDVLERFCAALEAFPVDTVIRATGDNPLVSWEMASLLLDQHHELDADYSGYSGLPPGCGVEIVRAECLLKAGAAARDPYDREHVTPYVYKNPQIFTLHRPLAPKDFRSRFSVSVDTRADFERVSRVFARLYRGVTIPIAELMSFIRTQESSA